MRYKLAIALAIAAACAGTGYCDTISFVGSNSVLGTSQVYGTAPFTVTVYGFTNPSVPTNLYGKNEGGSENGVGIATTGSEHEITANTFVQVDLANISGAYTLSIGSTQDIEGFNACISNTLGVLGACIAFPDPGSDPFTTSTFNTSQGRYISIQANGVLQNGSDNVLLDGLNFTSSPVPEPSSLLLLGTGILGAAGIIRRKLSI